MFDVQQVQLQPNLLSLGAAARKTAAETDDINAQADLARQKLSQEKAQAPYRLDILQQEMRLAATQADANQMQLQSNAHAAVVRQAGIMSQTAKDEHEGLYDFLDDRVSDNPSSGDGTYATQAGVLASFDGKKAFKDMIARLIDKAQPDKTLSAPQNQVNARAVAHYTQLGEDADNPEISSADLLMKLKKSDGDIYNNLTTLEKQTLVNDDNLKKAAITLDEAKATYYKMQAEAPPPASKSSKLSDALIVAKTGLIRQKTTKEKETVATREALMKSLAAPTEVTSLWASIFGSRNKPNPPLPPPNATPNSDGTYNFRGGIIKLNPSTNKYEKVK